MDRVRMRELLPVMKAFADGKEIEVRQQGRLYWTTATHPRWEDGREYRVKPQPESIWVIYRNGNRWHIKYGEAEFLETLEASKKAAPDMAWTYKRFAEVGGS